MLFSSCDKFKRDTKQERRSCTMFFEDLEKEFLDRVQRELVKWSLRRLGLDEWLFGTVMALYTDG